MMDFAPTIRPRARGENIVPMINVVFLLLIFFLMSAQIVPPDPFDVTLPQSEAVGELRADATLHVAASGQLAFDDQLGDAALERLARRDPSMPLLVRADAALPAIRLATLLEQLRGIGITDINLVTGQPRGAQ